MRILTILILLLLVSCGTSRQLLTIEGREYRQKKYKMPCGELNIKAKGFRGDFIIDMAFNTNDSTFIYGDSLKTTFNNKPLAHSFQIADTLLGEQERGVYIEIPPEYWSKSKTDSIRIDLDGMIYCQKTKIDFENIYIIIGH